MIKRILRNLRTKPKSVRNNIALGIAGTFTALVFSVWLYHFPNKISSLTEFSQSNKNKNTAEFTDFFGQVKDQIATLNEATENEVATTTSAANENDWRKEYTVATSSVELFTTASTTMLASSTLLQEEISSSTVAATSTPAIRPIRIVTTSSTLPIVGTTTEPW
ncbi:MAG: hypothetical protein RL097_553 [Candidatus Parcubacteria bacterium]|jgi:hypothetical protein